MPLRPHSGSCCHFYSRPCGRGDQNQHGLCRYTGHFYSRPCGRGDKTGGKANHHYENFYSRPCGRGDIPAAAAIVREFRFLLTPLREGRPQMFAPERIR